MARSRFYKLRYKQVPGIVLVTALFIIVAVFTVINSNLSSELNRLREMVQEGNRLCRAFYAPINATQCVTFELTDAGLLLVDHDGSKSPVTAIEFSKP